MKIEKKKRIIWVVGALAALCICFLLCRYLFFGLHGMKQFPVIVLIYGLIALLIAAIFDGRKVMICTVAGYIGGFALGMLFNIDGVDSGGGRTNNAWQIWLISFIIIVLAGIIWELVSKRAKKKKTP